MMGEPEESWDEIDWDKKIEEVKLEENHIEPTTPVTVNFLGDFADDSGNYFDINQMRIKQEQASKKGFRKFKGKAVYKEEVPYSYKDLLRIKSETQFQKVIYEIFGNFDKFIFTHEQDDLSDESLIELLKIDVILLEVPFLYHNKLLLEKISRIESFWTQVIQLIERFFEINWKDPKYLLLIDMRGFFEHIESLLFFIIAQNLMKYEMEKVFSSLMLTVGKFVDRKYFNIKRLQNVLEIYHELSSDLDIFEIIPSITDLKSPPRNLDKNMIHGEYSDIISYLKIQLPLLKEDFMCKLRSGFDHLRNIGIIDRVIRTHDAIIFPKVQIKIEWYKLWNMNCPIILAYLNYHANFFNGQILCFTSSQNLDDLIVATVLKCGIVESLDPNSVIIEIKRTENVENIFDREFYMIEPKSFFDPYYQVFGVLKSLNEHNFPFRHRILDLDRAFRFPDYEHPNCYEYKNYSLRVDRIDDFIKCDLGLESMQVDAVYRGISNDFSVLVGPPGSGKSYIGLQLLDILLKNTNEKILILTQTNNALDKFLIGCLQFTNEVVRLGGQCKNEILEPYIASTNIPYESRSYLKKLQAQQGDKVTNLLEANEDITKVFHEISLHYRLSEEINQLNSFCNINSKRVFGMTTSYAAHNSAINKMLKPGIVIIEEASEILESHILASLTKETKHVIMIGDHHQLRPQTNSYDLQRNFDFNISLFERLIFNKFPYIALDVQRRMRPEFCDLVRETIYNDLKDGPNVENYPNVKGMSRNFLFLNHNFPESVSETSKENLYEVEFILNLFKKLLDNGNDPSEIVILTPYAAQAKRFKIKLRELALPRVRVAILDAYQGEESDIILLSLVRSNKSNDIGFLAMENRISVILSRAKLGFYICGNIDCFAKSSRTWRKIKEILMRHKVIEHSVPNDIGI